QADTATTSAGAAVTIDVLANDNDPDGGTLTLTSVTPPASGSAVISANRIIYTPTAGFVGVDSFRYSVSDGQGGSGSALVSVSVGALANTPPVIRNDSATTQFEQPVTINVLANDSDADGDTLSVIAITTPSHGSVLLAGNVVTYTPDPGYSGADSFTYTASDGRGGQGTATVRIIVASASNRAPIANDDNATSGGLPVTVNVLANDSDPDGDPLTIVSVTAPIGGGAAAITGNSVTYTPLSGFVGVDRFNYTISDGHGGSASAMVTINVTAPVNRPPVAVPDAYTIAATSLVLVMPVLTNDSDPDGDPLTITGVTQPPTGQGTVAITGSGQTITFNRQTVLPATFTYTISDGRGGTATTSVTVTLATTINQPPVAVNDTVSLAAGAVFNVLINDSDPDGDPLTIISVTQPLSVGGSPVGTVAITGAGQTVTFNAFSPVTLPATFNYTISDGRGGTATATVTIQP
ncbi:MAG: Ig-like domain-containing protein, partial [Dokdonella sp.]